MTRLKTTGEGERDGEGAGAGMGRGRGTPRLTTLVGGTTLAALANVAANKNAASAAHAMPALGETYILLECWLVGGCARLRTVEGVARVLRGNKVWRRLGWRPQHTPSSVLTAHDHWLLTLECHMIFSHAFSSRFVQVFCQRGRQGYAWIGNV